MWYDIQTCVVLTHSKPNQDGGMNMQKYNVIDIDPAMTYAPGDEVIAVVEADSADKAIAAVMAQIGFSAAVIAQDPDGYAEHVLANVEAVPA